MREYPDHLLEDHYRLSALVVELVNRFKGQITVHIFDPQSLPGFIKSLRFWVRKYPTFIIDGEQKIVGWDQAALEHALQSRISKP